ncbi:MAG: TolC family protein, partial [Acidobacteriota bacterium]
MKYVHVVFFAVTLTAVPAFAVDWSNPDSVVQAAIEADPSLAARSAQLRAAVERVVPAGSLPNPMLMGGIQNRRVDLAHDFMTMRMVGVSQTVVLKSRRDARRRAAELEVESLQKGLEVRRAEVERDVRTAYVDAAAAQDQVAATEEIARVLQSVSDSSRIRYEAGAVPQADMIRAMLEQA